MIKDTRGATKWSGKISRSLILLSTIMSICASESLGALQIVSANQVVEADTYNLTIPPVPNGSEPAEITVTVTAAPGWTIVRKKLNPPWEGTWMFAYDGNSPGQAYNTTFQGRVEKDPPDPPVGGGGGGEPDNFFVKSKGEYIEPQYYILPPQQTVCVGQSATFTAYKQSLTPEISNWTLDGASQAGTASTTNFVSDTPGTYTVGAETNGLSDTAILKIIKVGIAEFDRVVPRAGNEKVVTVTVSPSPLPSGVSVELTTQVTAGAAGALVSPSSITQTTNVTVRGTFQSTERDNITLIAKVDGHVCDSEPFTICAHVTNWRTVIPGVDKGGGLLYFRYTWDSDSGNKSDLDMGEVGEDIKYPSPSYWPPDPPFDSWGPYANYRVWSTAVGDLQDNHSVGGGFSTPYSQKGYRVKQRYAFRCHRCLDGYWLTDEIDIDHIVEPHGDGWRYRKTKSGAEALLTLP